MAQFYARPGTSHYFLCVDCQTDEQLNELVRNCTETAFPPVRCVQNRLRRDGGPYTNWRACAWWMHQL
ncbi:hypothetical protein CRG92_07645 [Escherichia sp. E2586]|nr:hypothetical protein CRG92_07645 [Escherichia sp. E2586]